MYDQADAIRKLLDAARDIVIVQADNPDADSLGSALALESIFTDLGKRPYLYCGVDIPAYLRYMSGWDRVSRDLPKRFDLSFIVDASTMTLLEKLEQAGQKGWLAAKPCVVLDHHQTVEHVIPFAEVIINDYDRASTGELIYRLAKQLKWPVSAETQVYLASSILGDTQGLTNQMASSETYRIMADFIDNGLSRPALEEQRREFSKMPPEIYKYKAELINRTEFAANGRLAHVTVPQAEINKYSPLYNPAPLIQGDMLQTGGVEVAIVFKHYADGKITGAIRSNAMAPIAAKLAEGLGGGGHPFASGFKVASGRSLADIKNACLETATKLLDNQAGDHHENL